jgi:hypothetical protein
MFFLCQGCKQVKHESIGLTPSSAVMKGTRWAINAEIGHTTGKTI